MAAVRMTGVEMMMRKIRPGTIVLFAALLLIGACSGDSPTAPPPGGNGGTGGGTPPPTGASVTLDVSNSNPIVNSTSTITATVTENGNPVPDGTAVEFKTTFGTFVVGQSTAATVVKTTVSGKAVVTLTSTAAGQALVTARVNNVYQQVSVSFKAQGTDPDPGTPVAVITSVTPDSGPPAGGTVVTLRGQNFEGPVRVLFGGKEASVASVTSTEVKVISPSVEFDVGEEQREVPITVIFEAGTTGETSVQAPTAFRYQIEALTPQVIGVSPSSGPNEGGTVVSIIGSGFQAPVKVFFMDAADLPVEASVQQVTFNQIIAVTPKASGMGAGLANEFVGIRVVNMLSGKEVVTGPLFRYGPLMQITGFGPGGGPATGGTVVTIYGWGFDDPVAVSIGGVGATPIKVSGTEIVAVTAPAAEPCGDSSGEVVVTNIEDGTTATSDAAFEYAGSVPVITGISPSATTPGANVNITVANAGSGNVRFNIGGQNRPASAGVPTANGNTVYTVSVPLFQASFFDTAECGFGGERYVPTSADVSFTNVTTGCSDDEGITMTINPIDTTCRNETAIPAVSPSTLNFGDQAVVAGPTAPLQVSVSNAGGGTLSVLGATSDDTQFIANGTFPASLTAGQSTTISVTFDPNAAGPQDGKITISTSEGDVTVAVIGNGI